MVGQAEHPGRAGPGDDGDLGEASIRATGRPGRDRARTRSGSRPSASRAVAAVHQQGDDLRVGEERAAVGVVGAQGDLPGVVDAQEPLQADRPLQGVDGVLVLVGDRHDAAAGLQLDVVAEPLPAGDPVEVLADRPVGRHARGLAEDDLADVDA